ncbi:hypothetical protein L873DRAFT_1806116 [Choiromyces venosus 120613-1]|uniref:Uncharacterized protein n=1 Tax=Choiromyces venosus 120613-1 TaxID=1336337 RepID=A0A3N4K217_9PEZI|nr:hypothetical protein L873DRAFT_1806116 [Choiromyces venosus 120613-1]
MDVHYSTSSWSLLTAQMSAVVPVQSVALTSYLFISNRGISQRKVRDRYLCDNSVYYCNKRT